MFLLLYCNSSSFSSYSFSSSFLIILSPHLQVNFYLSLLATLFFHLLLLAHYGEYCTTSPHCLPAFVRLLLLPPSPRRCLCLLLLVSRGQFYVTPTECPSRLARVDGLRLWLAWCSLSLLISVYPWCRLDCIHGTVNPHLSHYLVYDYLK